MPTDTLKIKQRLVARESFTKEQADDLIAALFDADDPVVTRSVLRSELRKWALRIVLASGAVTAALLALFGFAASFFV